MLTIATDSMDLAGDLVQSLGSYLGIEVSGRRVEEEKQLWAINQEGARNRTYLSGKAPQKNSGPHAHPPLRLGISRKLTGFQKFYEQIIFLE